MKDIIIQKLNAQIDALQNAQADAFLVSSLPSNPALSDYQALLKGIMEGSISTP